MMKLEKFMRKIWFDSDYEREWFREQYLIFYSYYQRIIVLYALKRLSMIFKCAFEELSGERELLSLLKQYKSKHKIQAWLFSISPIPCSLNPMQIIMDDFSCAKDDFASMSKALPASGMHLTPFREQMTVADYVCFISEYDALEKMDGLRVVSSLGITPP